MRLNRGAGEFIVPTDARPEFRALIQRANRRVLSNLNYIKQENIRDAETKQALVFDFHKRRSWETAKAPFSASTKFASERQYQAYLKFIKHWGEDRGRRGDFAAAPENIKHGYKAAIYKSLNSLLNIKGISLEEWGGELPPDIVKSIEGLTITQMRHFFNFIDDEGVTEEFDSDGVGEGSIEDFIDYVGGRLDALKKFYPHQPKPKKKKKAKKKKSAQKKARRNNRKKR